MKENIFLKKLKKIIVYITTKYEIKYKTTK